ncbi:MAG: type II toxin-antitoxin system RelE/ParE family toxin [Anaerolineales bacterium]
MTDDANEYELVIAQRFLKDMRRISREDQVRVRRALGRIQLEPYRGRKVVAAETGQYRWRVGNLRLRYDIEGRKIQVLRVKKREDAYR